MTAAQPIIGVRYRVKHFLSRLGEDRYYIVCSVDGKPWHTLRGPNGRTRRFHSEAAANAAMAAEVKAA